MRGGSTWAPRGRSPGWLGAGGGAPGTEASRVFLYQIPEVWASFPELLHLPPPWWTSSLWLTASVCIMSLIGDGNVGGPARGQEFKAQPWWCPISTVARAAGTSSFIQRGPWGPTSLIPRRTPKAPESAPYLRTLHGHCPTGSPFPSVMLLEFPAGHGGAFLEEVILI